jgi:hypothetical protein
MLITIIIIDIARRGVYLLVDSDKKKHFLKKINPRLTCLQSIISVVLDNLLLLLPTAILLIIIIIISELFTTHYPHDDQTCAKT